MLYTYYKRYGSSIQIKYIKDGQRYKKTVSGYKPTLYTKSNEPNTDKTSIFGDSLTSISFDSIREANEFVERYAEVDDFEIIGNANFDHQFITELYSGKTPNFNPDEIHHALLDIEVYSPDSFPYPKDAAAPVNGYTVYSNLHKKYFVCSDKPYLHLPDSEVGHLNVEFKQVEDEREILMELLNLFEREEFDLVSGWNSSGFDLPYIVNRCYKIIGEDTTKRKLSPFNNIYTRMGYDNFGNDELKVTIAGLPHCDYLDLYKKHIHTPRESYKLDFIASEEVGTQKIDFEEAGSLHRLYDTDPQTFVMYNIRDVELLVKLEEKLKLFQVTYALAYTSLSNYEDTLGSVGQITNLVAKHLYNNNIVPTFKLKEVVKKSLEGAYVKDSVTGKHKWVVTFDLNSLYPHLIMQVNIGPETYVPRHQLPPELAILKSKYTLDDLVAGKVDLSILKKYGLSMGGNFEFYKKDKKSFLSDIMYDLYNGRKTHQKNMRGHQHKVVDLEKQLTKASGSNKIELEKELLNEKNEVSRLNNLQQALKILLNSVYGALSNQYFLYYNHANAESITLTGQLVNRYTMERVDKFLKEILDPDYTYWLAGDTDSGFITLAPFVDQLPDHYKDDPDKITSMVDRFCEEVLTPKINQITDELADYLNSYENKMVWGREVISPSTVLIAKKKYVMAVYDNEGVRYPIDNPRYKITGMESKKSSTPQWARTFLEECYKTMLHGKEEDIQKLISSYREQFDKLPVWDIAQPRGVTNLSKYIDKQTIYTKGTPKHVRAALLHNHLLKVHKITNIEPISAGSKMKFIDLKIPNPIHENVIGFEQRLPDEFGLTKYVDRDIVFESSFLKPLQIALNAIEWDYEPKVSIESFFM